MYSQRGIPPLDGYGPINELNVMLKFDVRQDTQECQL